MELTKVLALTGCPCKLMYSLANPRGCIKKVYGLGLCITFLGSTRSARLPILLDAANDGIRPEDWGGDLVEGRRGTGYIVTHVERLSRYLLTSKYRESVQIFFNTATIEMFRKIEPCLRKAWA